MIAQEIAAEVVAYIAGLLPATVTVREAGDDVDVARPCVVVTVEDVEEFDTLMRGNWWATIEAELTTVPADTSLGDFSGWVERLECVLQDKEELAGALQPIARRVHEYRPDPSEIETRDNLRLARVRTTVLIEKKGRLRVQNPISDAISASSVYLTASG